MDLKEYREIISMWESPEKQTDDRRYPYEAPRHVEALAGLYFKYAIELHNSAHPVDEIRKYLRLAGEYAVLEYEQRGHPTNETYRNFYDLNQRVLGLVTCWCERPWRKRLVSLPEWSYDWPFDFAWKFAPGEQEKPRSKVFKYFRAYARAARGYLSKGTFNPQDHADLVSPLEAGKGPQKEQEGEEATHSFRGLKAVATGNGAAFTNALKALLQLHDRRATRGSYRSMLEGRICLNGMFLAKMAQEKGIKVSSDSKYLPLRLFLD